MCCGPPWGAGRPCSWAYKLEALGCTWDGGLSFSRWFGSQEEVQGGGNTQEGDDQGEVHVELGGGASLPHWPDHRGLDPELEGRGELPVIVSGRVHVLRKFHDNMGHPCQ